jgi:hypothetical protein
LVAAALKVADQILLPIGATFGVFASLVRFLGSNDRDQAKDGTADAAYNGCARDKGVALFALANEAHGQHAEEDCQKEQR